MDSFVFDALLNNLPQSIFWKNTSLEFQGCNLSFLRQFGFCSLDKLIGKTDYDLPIPIELANKFRSDDLQVIQTQIPKINYEETSMMATGEERIVLVNKFPYFDGSNHVRGVLGVFTDITELKRAEAREKTAKLEAEKAKILAESEKELRKTVMVLVGDIVHDLLTPIATIRTATDNLHTRVPTLIKIIGSLKGDNCTIKDSLNPKEWDYLARNAATIAIKKAITMMDCFINTTLFELNCAQAINHREISRKDLTKCSSRRVLENTLEAFTFPNTINVIRDIAYDFYFMGNPILMIKIMFNILHNAVEQIQLHGHGSITITTGLANNYNIITIRDTGGGAPPEIMDKIFEGYFSTKEAGTGVGLAFCKKIMKIFGGDIICESQVGAWMKFSLSFPKID